MGDVGNVIAILLEPKDRGELGAKQKVLGTGSRPDALASVEWAIIADLVGAAGGGIAARAVAAIEVIAEPAIIGLPRRIRRLEEDVARRFVSTDNKRDVVLVAGIRLIDKVRDVDAGYRAGGDRPGRRYRPIAGIY